MEIIFTQIANLGFPIVVSIFLLVRIESKLTDIT
ncbi:YvrJ family protein, partial [Senegalia sp. (in: firmicutes)]